MSELVRLSISLEKQLLTRLDKVVSDCKYENRSEFIRDLVRHKLVERAGYCDKIVIGTITILYTGGTKGLQDKINSIFVDKYVKKLASTTISMDDGIAAEMVMVTGRASVIYSITENLATIKGVSQTSVNYTGHKTDEEAQ